MMMSIKFDRGLIRIGTTGVIVVLALVLAACGGDSGSDNGPSRDINLQGATNPASLAAPADAAKAYVAVLTAMQASGLSGSIAVTMSKIEPAPGKSAKCPGSGSIERQSNGVSVARQCKVLNNGSAVGDVYDGVINTHCKNGVLGLACSNFKPVFGSNGGEGVPFQVKVGQHDEILILGSSDLKVLTINNAPEITATLNEKIALKFGAGKHQLAFFTSNFKITRKPTPSPSVRKETYNGVLGFGETGGQFNCTVGQLTVTTLESIETDSEQGKLRFQNSLGQKAIVALAGNGSISVTMSGDTTTFKANALKNYCKFE